MSTLTDLKVGQVVKIQDAPYVILWSQFMRKQMRKPVMQTKMRNLINGSVLEKTFLAGETYQFAEVERRRCQYLYRDDAQAHFMDNTTFEQFSLPMDAVEATLKYLKDDTEVYVTFYEEKPIAVQQPIKVSVKVIETTPGVRGDTATGGSKQATVETGAVVNVPLFIEEGETVIINTETDEYVGRDTSAN
jgi:elongation factor P